MSIITYNTCKLGNIVEVIISDYAVRRVGNNEQRSMAGVDVPGVAFLLPDSFQTDARSARWCLNFEAAFVLSNVFYTHSSSKDCV